MREYAPSSPPANRRYQRGLCAAEALSPAPLVGSYTCPHCRRWYCVNHCVPSAHGCPVDIVANPTMIVDYAPWRNLFHPNEWAYLTQKIEQWGGLLGVCMTNGVRQWTIQVAKRQETDEQGRRHVSYRYQLWLPTMGAWTGTWRNTHRSETAATLEDLIDLHMSADHRYLLHLAVARCAEAEKVAAGHVHQTPLVAVSDTQPEAVMDRLWRERHNVVEGAVIRPALPPASRVVSAASPFATIELAFLEEGD